MKKKSLISYLSRKITTKPMAGYYTMVILQTESLKKINKCGYI